ncbi:Reverse transcriptase domain-containing protein [Abeliophyllum distichum]|uniref:Reverse transcriptase domain-containing protein n=1 Tax=Abeliophyllum distichum TaxID=126358 RepID=A0ABD1T1P5_9LAMI
MPLRIDEATVDLLRPSEARVCVDLNLEHKLPDRIWIDQGESRSFWQPIVYEKLPHFCTKCHHMGHIIDHCRVGAPPLDTVVTQASKPAVAPASKPIVVSANKPIDAPMTIVDRTGKGKEKEVVVEIPRQWIPVAGSSSVVAIPPPVVHVGPTLNTTTIPTIVASKPCHDAVFLDPLLDHMMFVLHEYPVFSEPMQPDFDIDPQVHQQEYFRRNSSDDLVGLDERQENESDKIWYFWNLGTTVTSIVDHPQFLHIKVEDPRLARPLFITPVYASCSLVGRRDLWTDLHQISLCVDGSWLVERDFNMIAHNSERTGGNTSDKGTSDFAALMMDCGLTDTGTSEHSHLLIQWSSDVDLGLCPFRFPNRVRDAERRVDETELDHDRDPSPSHRNTLHQAQAVLNRALSIEEAFWKQKAGARWTCEGDHNTRYFHSIYSSGPTHSSQDPVYYFSFGIDPDSVARLDGFLAHFFQVYWDIVSEDVLQTVLDVFAGGYLPRGFASTFIILLPKRDNAYTWSEFRPISLCTIFYKLITKLMNSQLSTLLPHIISAPQSRFISGWLIGDNVLLHMSYYKHLIRKCKGGNVILKLDMAKGYDRMD